MFQGQVMRILCDATSGKNSANVASKAMAFPGRYVALLGAVVDVQGEEAQGGSRL